MNYQCTLVSAAANTVGHGYSWIEADGETKSSLIAYSASNFIAIADDETKAVKFTLRGGKVDDKITCLTHIKSQSSGTFIVSGFQSGALNVWRSQPVSLQNWVQVSADTSLTGSLNSLSALDFASGVIISAFDSVGSGKIWRYNYATNTLDLQQTFKFTPHQLPNSCHMTTISENIPVLVLGSVDGKVHLYVGEEKEFKLNFTHVGALLGHEEWITCLASKDVDSKNKFIASGSQDTKIRIWKISEQGQVDAPTEESKISTSTGLDGLDEDEDEDEEGEEGDENQGKASAPLEDEELSSEARFSFIVDKRLFFVYLESLLVGHEDWVTTIHWMPNKLQLFSTSMDRNMVIWAPDSSLGGVWTPSVRVGDVGGALGGCIGGNLLGFVGGCVSPDGNAILGIGYGGSFHYWRRQSDNEEGRWVPVTFLTGHFDSVNDLAWDPIHGRYLVSVSSDQTCRLFAEAKTSSTTGWREISRPEIHGYNLNCIALAKENSFYIYTGGEEKLIRIFDAPNSVLRGLQQLCSLQIEYDPATRVEQAYIPELGLSNKGKETMTAQEKKEQESRGVAAINWSQPPLESQLADNTLWLEIKKMFGHNNEVVTMKMSKDGRWLASSSKARYTQGYHVIIWSTQQQDLVSKLEGHESTVVCIDFSHDGQYLASSGKDRTLCIYIATQDDKNPYTLAVCLKSAHKRIVWDCCWIANRHRLVTVARDGVCKLWNVTNQSNGVDLSSIFSWQPFDSVPVTAIAVYDETEDGENYLAVVGSEEGKLQVWNLNSTGSGANKLSDIPLPYCHGKAVKRIAWRPLKVSGEISEWLQFATCGEDNSVRVHKISK